MTTHYGLFGNIPTTSDPSELAKLKGYGRGLKKSTLPGTPELWAVGRAVLGELQMDVPISWSDIEKDTAWAAKMLDELGVKAGDFSLYSFLYAQSQQFWPWLKASFDRRAPIATGSAWSWDAGRHEMYLRLFEVKLAFGASGDTIKALEAMGHDVGKAFARAGTVVVLPDAHDRLRELGLKPWRIGWLGPIFALDPGDGSGGRFDTDQWTLESVDGQILITSHDRHTKFDRTPTQVKGRIETVDGEARFFHG